jgi:hypothetical protein
MSKLLIALIVAGLGFAGTAAAQMNAPKTDSTPTSKDNYTVAKLDASAQYRIDRDACALLNGNAKDVCAAEAKGKENVAEADAKSVYQKMQPVVGNQGYADMRQAEYVVVIEECDPHAGRVREVCVSNANLKYGKP